MINKKRLLSSFLELIKINSPSLFEKNIADYLIPQLKELGFSVRIDGAGKKIGANCGNIIARKKGKIRNASTILLNAHLDTILPTKNVKAVVKGDVVRSDGNSILGADDRTGLAVIMEILQSIKEEKLPTGDIIVVFDIAEEQGLTGMKELDFSQLQADYAFVLDHGTPVGSAVVSAPTHDKLKAIFLGKSSHAGVSPEKGVSSIKAASLAISRMKLGRIDEETTANIGFINGGMATNIVPEETIIEGEARSRNLKKLEKQIKHMRDCIEKASKEIGTKNKIKVSREYPGFNISENDDIIRIAKKAARKLGLRLKTEPSGGGSGANIFNAQRIPAINISVGAENAHSNSERIKISNLYKSAQWVREIILENAKIKKL